MAHQKYLFRQFNKERLQGDFVVIQINSDFPYQMHKIHNPPDENFRMEVENMPNQELKELPGNIFFLFVSQNIKNSQVSFVERKKTDQALRLHQIFFSALSHLIL